MAENVASAQGRVKLQAQHSSKTLVAANRVKRIRVREGDNIDRERDSQ